MYVDIDQGIHRVKLKVARNEKQKKLSGFSFSTNIANFEAFCWTKKMISNLFFLKSVKARNVKQNKQLKQVGFHIPNIWQFEVLR